MTLDDDIIPSRLGPQDRIRIGGVHYRCLKTDDSGHLFERIDQAGLTEFFSHADFERAKEDPEYRFDRDWFAPGKSLARSHSGADTFADIPEEEQPEVIWRWEFCTRFMKMEHAGEASRSDASRKRAIAVIQEEIAALTAGKAAALRSGNLVSTRKPPCGKTLLIWVLRLENGGMCPTALRKRYRNCGNRTRRIPVEVQNLMINRAAEFADERKVSKVGQYKLLNADIDTLNAHRETAGLKPHRRPCNKTFYAEIAKLDAFRIYAGTFGVDAAKKHFAIVTTGLDVTRPFERIEMDDWKVSLQTLAVEAGAWDHLPAEMQDEIARRRWWLCAAIDCATDCIVGMRLAPEATSENAIAVLHMVVSDKKAYADAVGALSPWSMRATPEGVATDAGSVYTSGEFKGAVFALGSSPITPPAGLAAMRARIERFFGTARTQLTSRFTGQTFANTAELGDYPAEKRASMRVERFAQALVRYVVDVHHNTPCASLGGETPRNALLRLSRRYRVIPEPDQHTRRAIFGFKVERTIGSRGVRFMGLYYQSEELQAHRRKLGDAQVDVRVDLQNLGHVSVRIGDGWAAVPCQTKCLEGVTFYTWRKTTDDLRRRFAAEAELSEPIVLAAIRAIEAMSIDASLAANISSTRLTIEELDRAERSITLTIRSVNATAAEEATSGGDAFDANWSMAIPAEQPTTAAPSLPPPQIPPTAWSIDDD